MGSFIRNILLLLCENTWMRGFPLNHIRWVSFIARVYFNTSVLSLRFTPVTNLIDGHSKCIWKVFQKGFFLPIQLNFKLSILKVIFFLRLSKTFKALIIFLLDIKHKQFFCLVRKFVVKATSTVM